MRIIILVGALLCLFAQVWGQGGIELAIDFIGTVAGEAISNLIPSQRAKLHSSTSPSWPNYKWGAILYKDAFHEGEGLWVWGESNECVNIDRSFMQDLASNIDTFGSCVRLHDGKGCTGIHERIYPGSQHHVELGKLGLNDLVSSVSSCPWGYNTRHDTKLTFIDSSSSNVWHRTRYGVTCTSECVKNTGIDGYNYCNTDGGSWEKCSRRPGTTIYGQGCLDDCGKFGGTSYYWCHVHGTNVDYAVSWDYCSIPFHY